MAGVGAAQRNGRDFAVYRGIRAATQVALNLQRK